VLAGLSVCALAASACGGPHQARKATSHATTPASVRARTPASARARTLGSSGATTPASAIAQAQATHEYPSPPPPPQTVAGGASTPERAIQTFATAYINWTAQTVAAGMRTLAARSVGQARSAMALAAAETAADYELHRGGIANHGTVEAVAPLPGSPSQYVVVTLESTTASNTTAYQGLLPAWHVALAAVTKLPDGQWVLSVWQPEN
jgi:hypothetical protein